MSTYLADIDGEIANLGLFRGRARRWFQFLKISIFSGHFHDFDSPGT